MEAKSAEIFNEEELEAEIEKEKVDSYAALGLKKSKHTLDSDEEDDDVKAEKYNVLDPNDLEGQEDGTIDFDGEIKITPFNMKEELEEGYFDKEGTYIFQKETDVVKDQWLDDIDWVKVKARENPKRKQEDQSSDSDDDEPLQTIDLIDKYRQMLVIMKPFETVQKAICRLGGGAKHSASNRWKKKKEAESSKVPKDEKDVEKLQVLTRLADDIVQSGDMDIYQQTYEKMSFVVNAKEEAEKRTNGSGNADAELDMFGDEFEESVDESKPPPVAARTPSPTAENTEDDVKWEFKWENTDEAKIYGPYPTTQMQQWVDEKYFEGGVFVRQIGKQNKEFYTSKRIDFELYL